MRRPHLVLTVHAVLCLAALTWPVYPWICARVEARPLGLPFPFAWHVSWVLASLVVLAGVDRALERSAQRNGKRR